MKKSNKLNFGSGRDIKSDHINADITKFKGVDSVFDFNVFPYPFKKNTFEQIYADNVLEHLSDLTLVLKELHRISKPNGEIRIIVPYYNCFGAYNDVTHHHYFSHLAFSPFYQDRTRGNYFIDEKFTLGKINFVPTRLGRLILPRLRLPFSQVFGQIIQAIDITLIVKK